VEKKVAKAERDVHQKGEKYRVLKEKTDQRSEVTYLTSVRLGLRVRSNVVTDVEITGGARSQ
jgi:hypothetical protein